MSGAFRYTMADAAAVPLTPEGVAAVIAAARKVVMAQLGLAVAVSAVFLLGARATTAALSLALGGFGLISLWGVLATLLSAWDHARVSKLLNRHATTEIAREGDPVKFWRAHRGLFPYAWSP